MSATYRLQLHAGFTFADAEHQVDYLARLGVTHLYLSPILQPVPGSTHGYDVLDHTRISADLGGLDGLLSLHRAAAERGLGLIADVVPNHMSFVAPEDTNAPLWDVLTNGRHARHAHWFDVDWDQLDDRLGVPVLGDDLDPVLARGEITRDGSVLRYYDHVFPLAPGSPDTHDVRALLEAQHYLLGSWRDTARILNYRRFFDINSLIAVRVELPDVFDATHRLLVDLNHQGVLDGFRIDHPDGLANPGGYFRRLAAALRPGSPIYVEKILERGEVLQPWPVAGTTGYDATTAISLALADPATAEVLDRTWAATGGEPDLHVVVDDAKREAISRSLGPELDRLTRLATTALPDDADVVREGLVELLVHLEAYRAYLDPGLPVPEHAQLLLDEARVGALVARPDLTDVVERLLLLVVGHPQVAPRFQQTCGPVMAKGVEDTAFYRWHRQVGLNEVGGDPDAAPTPDALHHWARHQASAWPEAMTGLSTHDTKRSEDVRARLAAIAADPESWARCSEVFAAAADASGVDRPTAHLVWQTLVGVGQISAERLDGYLTKATREAKRHTTWNDPDEDYEASVRRFAKQATAPGPLREAVDAAVAANLAEIRATTLGQKLLQLLVPGSPDIYQGTEIVDLSLVDPDNRRAVDFDRRAALLEPLLAGRAPADLDEEKLLVTCKALRVRKEHPAAFSGDYVALQGNEHLLGFVRAGKVACLTTRAPRRLAETGGWGEATVTLPGGAWRDELTGRSHTDSPLLADVFADLPVALLVQA